MNNIDKLIQGLNKEQKDAVLSTEGPNLIVAGAGSGKTRVLTTRLIHIIHQKKLFKSDFMCDFYKQGCERNAKQSNGTY